MYSRSITGEAFLGGRIPAVASSILRSKSTDLRYNRGLGPISHGNTRHECIGICLLYAASETRLATTKAEIDSSVHLQKNPVSVTGNEILREGVPLLEDIEDVAIRL